MPKHKKAKIHKRAGGAISHEEIWDDSALIRSWNDAVAEYEYYHSIVARGEDVEELLHRAEEAEANGKPLVPDDTAQTADDFEDGEVEDDDDEEGEGEGEGEEEEEDGEVVEEAPSATNATRQVHGPVQPAADTTALPPQVEPEQASQAQAQALLDSSVITQDQTLENIKMAYYWAGYYSGLHDGQRQAAATVTSGHASKPS